MIFHSHVWAICSGPIRDLTKVGPELGPELAPKTPRFRWIGMDSKVFEKRLNRSAGEGFRHEKGHFSKCPEFVICDPVSIQT
jgi:hypothetical protein